MSSPDHIQLTEEQKKFLMSLEDEFKDRYTENDEEFKAVLNEKPKMPPVVENWVKPRHRENRVNYRGMRRYDDHGNHGNHPHLSKFYH